MAETSLIRNIQVEKLGVLVAGDIALLWLLLAETS